MCKAVMDLKQEGIEQGIEIGLPGGKSYYIAKHSF